MSSSSMDFSDRILKQVGPAALLAANTQSFKNLRSPSASSKLRAQASVHVIKEEEDEEVVAVTDERQLSLTPVPSVPSVSPNELEKLLHSVGPATLAAASQSMERIIVTPSLAVKAGTGSGTPTHASPRLLNGINPTRREYIIRILRKSIPLVAKARREVIKKNAAYARLCILDAFQGKGCHFVSLCVFECVRWSSVFGVFPSGVQQSATSLWADWRSSSGDAFLPPFSP